MMHRRYIDFDKHPTGYYGVPCMRDVFKTQYFSGKQEVLFEGHYLYAPADIDGTLRDKYGDYMQLPPPEDRIYKHHLTCYDTEAE